MNKKRSRIAIFFAVLIMTVTIMSVTAFAASGSLTAAQAKEIALATVGGGTVTKCETDYDHGTQVYEIDIIFGDKKYEMDVAVGNGQIYGYTVKTIGANDTATNTTTTSTTKPVSSGSEITAARAKEIALARVGGGTVVECKLDYENGVRVYEVKIINGYTEYEIDVRVSDGSIVKSETDYEDDYRYGYGRYHDDDDDDDDDYRYGCGGSRSGRYHDDDDDD